MILLYIIYEQIYFNKFKYHLILYYINEKIFCKI